MHVRPLIVTGCVYNRAFDHIEPGPHPLEKLLGRWLSSRLGVTAMNRERGSLPVNLAQQPLVSGVVFLPIWHAAKRDEAEATFHIRTPGDDRAGNGHEQREQEETHGWSMHRPSWRRKGFWGTAVSGPR